MLKQGLELKQTQKLSPLQIQTIKLIELPIQELEQRVKAELEDNPVLDDSPAPEKEDSDDEPRDVSIDEMDADDPIPSYKLRVNNYGKDERPQYNTFSVKESFTQSLLEQLGFRNLSKHDHDVAAFIIGSLDGAGYLRRDIDSVVDDLAFRANIESSPEEVERLLSLIQEFSNKHFQKIISKLGLSEDEMKAVISRIIKLNPSPGGQIDDSYNDQAQQIVPDFVLDIEDGEMRLSMPRFSIPEIRVNKKYAELLVESQGSSDRQRKEAATFVKQKLDSAKWFVEALKQRHNTLKSTMEAILEYQHDYFLDGDESHLKPMVLKDIAEKTGFDISTISRVVNSKYIETHFGIFPLKYFFSEGLENQEGEEVSTRELKKALKDCVDSEDKRKPLTDDQLVAEMGKKGYKVARRTIAKYRDQLDIPKARLRKEL